jgi:type VI secretion system protein ImpG
MGMAVLAPGQQVQTMPGGYLVKRGTRLISSLQPGLSTRCTYTTGQDVTSGWPSVRSGIIRIEARSPRQALGQLTVCTGNPRYA